jgi:hypothetical protein
MRNIEPPSARPAWASRLRLRTHIKIPQNNMLQTYSNQASISTMEIKSYEFREQERSKETARVSDSPVMNNDQFFNRVAEVLSEELSEPEQWYYLSFADSEFHGAVVVKAHGITDALFVVNALRINPGGEVLCVLLPGDKIPAEEFRNRLLNKKEIEAMWGEPCKTIREWGAEEDVAGKSS